MEKSLLSVTKSMESCIMCLYAIMPNRGICRKTLVILFSDYIILIFGNREFLTMKLYSSSTFLKIGHVGLKGGHVRIQGPFRWIMGRSFLYNVL